MSYESEAPDIYRGMNPAFVRRVWAKRRGGAPRPRKSPSPPIKWSPSDIEEIAGMLTAGMSSGQIANRFSVTKNSISGLVSRAPELKVIGFQTSYAKKLRGEIA